MLRSILVPLDGSTFGEHALPLAMSLARRAGAVLHLVRVHEIVPPTTLAGIAVMNTIDTHVRQDEQAYLADLTRRVSESSGGELKPQQQVKGVLIEGEIAPTLREYAEKNDIGLVVMSTHGRGALGRFWLGSVADDLIRELSRPILLIRPHEGKPDLHRQPELKSIVLPLDGGERAEQIIEPALDLGKLFDATFTLVRVVAPVLRPTYMPAGMEAPTLTPAVIEEVQHVQKQHQQDAQAYLDGVASRMKEQGCGRVWTRVVVEEEPASGIMLEAQVRHADLIAMETHGRSGLSRMLVGSVADKIVRSGLVPVLLHRRKWK